MTAFKMTKGEPPTLLLIELNKSGQMSYTSQEVSFCHVVRQFLYLFQMTNPEND